MPMMRLYKITNTPKGCYVDDLLLSNDIPEKEPVDLGLSQYLYVKKVIPDNKNGVLLHIAISNDQNFLALKNDEILEKPLDQDEKNVRQNSYIYIYQNDVMCCSENNMSSIYWLKKYLKNKFNYDYDIIQKIKSDAVNILKNVHEIELLGIQDINTNDAGIQKLLNGLKDNTPDELFRSYKTGITIKIKPRAFRKMELVQELSHKRADVDNITKTYIEELDDQDCGYIIKFGKNGIIKNNELVIKKQYDLQNILPFEQRKNRAFRELIIWREELFNDGDI